MPVTRTFSAPPPVEYGPFDGLLLVDKPAGPTSHDVVHKIRRTFRIEKVGHGGTLDPAATGLLVILIGRATRLAPFINGLDKSYLATIRLGMRSESGDPEGPITPGGPPPGEAALGEALAALVVESDQQVPALSAVKVDGERLYALTRRGEGVERPTRKVVVSRADLVSYDPMTGLADVDIRCGSGTYVRQLAVDLGEALGCGGYCHALRRTEVGDLSVNDAIALEDVAPGCGVDAIEVVLHLAVEPIDAREAGDVAHGRPVPGHTVRADGPVALAHDGALVAIAEVRGDVLRPRVVLT
jgi:tRNA pseudouridine55 synthase